MTKEEAIKTLHELWRETNDSWYEETYNMAIEALKAEPKCVAQIKVDIEEIARRIKEEYDITDGWIPCSERLPSEKDGRVLVTKRGEVMIAIHSEFSDTWYLGEMCAVGDENPIAWMPLPKPYKEDQIDSNT